MFVQGLGQHLRMVEVTQQVTECIDPKNNKFLALALAVSAEMVISSDPHLTQMHPWRGIPILPPAAFLVSAR